MLPSHVPLQNCPIQSTHSIWHPSKAVPGHPCKSLSRDLCHSKVTPTLWRGRNNSIFQHPCNYSSQASKLAVQRTSHTIWCPNNCDRQANCRYPVWLLVSPTNKSFSVGQGGSNFCCSLHTRNSGREVDCRQLAWLPTLPTYNPVASQTGLSVAQGPCPVHP